MYVDCLICGIFDGRSMLLPLLLEAIEDSDMDVQRQLRPREKGVCVCVRERERGREREREIYDSRPLCCRHLSLSSLQHRVLSRFRARREFKDFDQKGEKILS